MARRGRVLAGFALAGALLAAVGAYARWVEPRWIEVTHHVIGAPAPGRAPLRVVQLSDLHLRGIGRHERRVAELVRAERPDVLVLTGDLVDHRGRLRILDAFLSLLPRTRAVACLGNWERWSGEPIRAIAATLERHGVALLVNASLAAEHGGSPWRVAAVDDAVSGFPDARRALGDDPGPNVLVLSHSPAWRDEARLPAGVAAILSGHTHGGQVAPFGLALRLPEGSGRYRAGWYRGPPADIYVSRGIGTSILPLRLGARPEIAVFDWYLR